MEYKLRRFDMEMFLIGFFVGGLLGVGIAAIMVMGRDEL